MAQTDLRTLVLDILEPEAPARGLDIVDVEVAGARKAPLVRVYVDHAEPAEGPIDLDAIAEASRWISAALDAADPVSGPYTLEVSSPGLERPLRRERDFARFLGREASVRLAGYEGRRHYTGILRGVADGTLTLEVDGEAVELPLQSVSRAHLKLDLDDL